MKSSCPPSGEDPFLPLARALGHSDSMACLLLDGSGAVLDASPGAGAVLGAAGPPRPGDKAAGLFPAEGAARLEAMARDALSSGRTGTALIEAAGPDGTRLILAASMIPLPGDCPGGAVLAFLGRDITAEHEETEKLRRGTLEVIRLNAELRRESTARKCAEEATAEREARLRAILNGAGEGILTVDEQGLIENANPAADAMFGYPPDGLEGVPFESVAPGVLGRLEAAQPGPGPGSGQARPREATGVRLSGARFPMEITVSVVALPMREIRTCIVRDITARRRAEEARRLYARRLADQQAALERDLRAAAEIQRALLPKDLPDDPRYQAAWLFEPSAAIGGDVFNILSLGPDLLAGWLLDVSGHGVPSALVAAAAAQALQFHARRADGAAPSPEAVLTALDREFPLERFDRYFSIFFFTLDLSRGALSYSNAGHPFPLLARASGAVERLEAGGPIIGLGGLLPFDRGEASLSPGDRLLLYTDGLTEFESGMGRSFGRARLERWVKRHPGLDASVTVSALRRSIARFGGRARPQDDLTVLALRYGAPAAT